MDLLLDYDSSDDDEQENIYLNENCFDNEEEDTIWLGTDNGG
jgi:hypothetical protein